EPGPRLRRRAGDERRGHGARVDRGRRGARGRHPARRVAHERGAGGARPPALLLFERRVVKKLVLIALAACAAFAAAPHRAEAGTCGISGKGTLWIDFADGSVPFWQEFARPGVIAAAANFIYPPQLRALGAKTIYWDMYLPRRVGTPLQPFDPGLVIERANRLYDVASLSSACTQPIIAENEMSGANTITPWSTTNAQYRRNLL